MNEEIIAQINTIIAEYFKANTTVDWIPAKEIMPDLVNAGVFKKDEKSGMPLRKVLRALDEKDALDQIPFVHPERIEKNTYWYFVREGAQYTPKEVINPISKKQRIALNRQNSDETYILDLCDELLDEKAVRQHTFDFLMGDFHQDGRTRTPIALDGFYFSKNLAVDYTEKQDTEESTIDNADKMTVSGVTRAEQRKIYNRRKREVLRKKEVNFIEIKYKDFDYDDHFKLVRNKDKNLHILSKILKKYLKGN